MGTRSTIALEFADGTVEQVYCHWDGYLSGVGAELQSDYMDPFALRNLIDEGDMSTIGEPYSNRGEDCPARKYATVTEYFVECQGEEYDYILRPVGGVAVWFVRCYATDGKWVTFAEASELEALATEDEDY